MMARSEDIARTKNGVLRIAYSTCEAVSVAGVAILDLKVDAWRKVARGYNVMLRLSS